MTENILVWVEQRNGQIRKAAGEVLFEARRLCTGSGGKLVAFLAGGNVAQLAATLARYRTDKILVADDPSLESYSTERYTEALVCAVKKENPRYVMAAHTAMSQDLIPRAAARTDSACVTDITELREENDVLRAVHPMYSGKVLGVFELTSPLSFLTLRPNVFPPDLPDEIHESEMEQLAFNPAPVRAQVVATVASTGVKVELSEAPIIVSGGRGIKGPEHWPMLQELCDVLGAALGASRAVVDAGWIDHQHQVGQSGKTVSPKLYIAVGISGAVQHLAGMSSSKVIVAINNNPDALIFQSATYGIVGDCLEIVPKLTSACRTLLSES